MEIKKHCAFEAAPTVSDANRLTRSVGEPERLRHSPENPRVHGSAQAHGLSQLTVLGCARVQVADILERGVEALALADGKGAKICFGSDLLGTMHKHQSAEFAIRSRVQTAGGDPAECHSHLRGADGPAGEGGLHRGRSICGSRRRGQGEESAGRHNGVVQPGKHSHGRQKRPRRARSTSKTVTWVNRRLTTCSVKAALQFYPRHVQT